jgi:rod shape-determining protein MreD
LRKLLLAIPLLAVALLLQLTVLNGLQLPGGGVPDLMLVVVASLALAAGPVPGMVIGFAAGLAVDLAPPGSPVIGQYALAFCLVGWLGGRLQPTAARSAARAVVLLAVVIAGAECFIAGLARALGQVTVTQLRHVLPYTVAYDLLIFPFVLYLVLLASSWLDNGLVAGQPAAGLLPGPDRLLARRARKKAQSPQPHQPQLRRAAARHGDGWLVTGPRALPGQRAPGSAAHRLRPGRGVAGSASGYAYSAARTVAAPVHLRLSGGRRGDGTVGSAPGGPRLAGHPALLAGGRSRVFRPHGGLPGGSAAASFAVAPVSRGPSSSIRFRNYRGDAGLAGSLGTNGNAAARPVAVPRLRLSRNRSPALNPARPVTVPKLRFNGSRSAAVPTARATTVPKLRFNGSRSAAVPTARATTVPKLRFNGTTSAAVPSARTTATPKLDFRTRQRSRSRYRPAEPKFRAHPSAPRASALAGGAISNGTLDAQAFRTIRRKAPSPRLRLASARNASGMIGGTGRSPVAVPHGAHPAVPRFRAHSLGRRASGPGRKSPKFGYGRRSLLSFLTAKHIGGRWLASRRAGRRSGVWVISKRPGGAG